MRKLAALVGTTLTAAGLLLGAAGAAAADTYDNHAVSDDHSDYSRHNQCTHERHNINVLTCGIHVIELGNIG